MLKRLNMSVAGTCVRSFNEAVMSWTKVKTNSLTCRCILLFQKIMTLYDEYFWQCLKEDFVQLFECFMITAELLFNSWSYLTKTLRFKKFHWPYYIKLFLNSCRILKNISKRPTQKKYPFFDSLRVWTSRNKVSHSVLKLNGNTTSIGTLGILSIRGLSKKNIRLLPEISKKN